MLISEVIAHLESLKAEHGDIKVCHVSDDEYWGSIYNETSKASILCTYGQPDGPKSGKSELVIAFDKY